MATTTGSDVSDGPVLNLINKRLRALRKKLNRITQMEESIGQGKTLNKEQEEVFRSKSSVTAAIDELEKLRQSIAAAVAEEIDLAVRCKPEEENREGNNQVEREEGEREKSHGVVIEDLLNLLYFGSIFDVKTQSDFASTMLTRTHERGCCLTYDYVSDDDATDPLVEKDLDLISKVGNLLISRPVDTSLSHKNALEKCLEHAKLWLSKSDQPIEADSGVTYSLLREKLAKIMSSPYFTTLPEMKAPVEVVAAAAAAGNYGSFQAQVEGLGVQYQQKEHYMSDVRRHQLNELFPSARKKDEGLAYHEGNESSDNHAGPTDESHQGGYEIENSTEVPAQSESARSLSEGQQHVRDMESKEQQYVPRRQFQNQRGGRGVGGRRGYPNGRGGRGRNGSGRGGGPYQNGWNQYYDQPGNYYPKNNYYSNRGRGGGKGATGNSNNHDSAVQAES